MSKGRREESGESCIELLVDQMINKACESANSVGNVEPRTARKELFPCEVRRRTKIHLPNTPAVTHSTIIELQSSPPTLDMEEFDRELLAFSQENRDENVVIDAEVRDFGFPVCFCQLLPNHTAK